MLPLPKPILCWVTDRRSLFASSSEDPAQAALLAALARPAAADLDWIQIREKDLSGKSLAALARAALRLARPGQRILLNDRLDVAMAAGAHGVHLGESSLPAAEVTRWLRSSAAPPDFLVGVSCHSLESARAAAQAGASYIFFGPVFATPSKAAFGPPQGLERLADVCRAVRIPVLAIGGITAANAAACLSAGASGIAAIRLFQDPAAPLETLRRSLAGNP
ncbi:MAG: thiamine phosphate synthase [Acidobacteriia bacterium]|nr:thiamine phosphate synthase [Terriglobia bacterium]